MPNPVLGPRCGVKIALLLDASLSVADAGAVSTVRSAATTMLESLSGTGSSAALVQFGAQAGVLSGYQPIDSTTLGDGGVLSGAVAAYNPPGPLPSATGRQVWNYEYNPPLSSVTNEKNYSGPKPGTTGTNYDDALLTTRQLPGGAPDLVIFFTDGNPTAVNWYAGPGFPAFGSSNPVADRVLTGLDKASFDYTMDPAIANANALKQAGSRILVIGVGNSLDSAASQDRLKALSGKNLVNVDTGASVDLSTTDVIYTKDFAKLGQELDSLVTDLCENTFTITKLAQSPGSEEFLPAQGWEFTATPKVLSGRLDSWVKPAGATGASASAATDSGGEAVFQWKLSGSLATTSLVVEESARPGYIFAGATCTVSAPDGTTDDYTFTTNPFTLQVPNRGIVECEARNAIAPAPAGGMIELNKTASLQEVSAAGETFTYTLTATNTGESTLSGVTIVDDMPGLSALDCDQQQPAQLDPAQVLTCTATYQVKQSDIDAGEVFNEAGVSGTDAVGNPVSGAAELTIGAAAAPAITLAKSASVGQVSAAGETITYTLAATNTGNVTLDGVSIADPMPGLSALTCTPGTPTGLAPGGVLSCTATYQVTAADIAAGGVKNAATASGTDPEGNVVTAAASATTGVATAGVPVPDSSGELAGTGAGKWLGGGAAVALAGVVIGAVLYRRAAQHQA